MPEARAAMQFLPAIEDHLSAAREIGYGTVIKILLQFHQPFWNAKNKNIGFILSNEPIPTWWTQLPDKNPLLTGWLGGSAVKRLADAGRTALLSSPPGEEDLLDLSLTSLSTIFQMDKASLRQELVAWKILDWTFEPFVLGAYSFDKVESAAARKILSKPIRQVLFFAGEALYEGTSPGTVEAALSSGKEVADKIIRHTGHVMP
jgi:monoamine oxidase